MVEGSSKCIKYLVFIFNFLFFCTGCGLLGIGIWLNVERDDWEGISDYNYISVANVIIAAGTIVVIVAFLGCCGAIMENKCMLLVFFVFLVVIFLLEIGAGIAAYVWRGKVKTELRLQIEKRIPSCYYKEEGVSRAMNTIQKEFKCCGVNGIDDWKIAGKDKNNSAQMKVDQSCCKTDPTASGFNEKCMTRGYNTVFNTTTINQYYEKGCYSAIENFLKDNLSYVGITGVVFALFQIIGMVCAMVLYCAIRKEGMVV